jgi:3-oxoacyl-[acyl-carrier protein] reductase
VDVRGKTILVTGAGRGIGRAVALHFARQGAQLALLDTNAADVGEARTLCQQAGARAHTYIADTSREEDVIAALDQVSKDFGRLDGLVNNAGIVRDALLVKVKEGRLASKMTLAEWQAVIDVNLTGVFLCGREAAQRMIEGGGVIVNVSSVCRAGNAGQTNYSAAKAGVMAMTVAWAKELARFRIRVGAVAPGFVRTPMVESMKPDALARMIASIPLGRLGEPAEIAHAVAFIFESELFSGRCLEVDGGLRI